MGRGMVIERPEDVRVEGRVLNVGVSGGLGEGGAV